MLESAVKMQKLRLSRYHGSKIMLVDPITAYFPRRHVCFVELFGGSGSILLNKERSRVEVYNDLYHRAVNLFRVVRDPEMAGQLAAALYFTPYSREEFKLALDQPDTAEPVESARRFLVLSHQSRSAMAASGPVRTGWAFSRVVSGSPRPNRWSKLPEQVLEVCERLRGVHIESDDALKVLARYDGPETLFYVDPPYLPESRYSDLPAYHHDMAEAEHIALAETLNAAQGMAVLSSYPSPLYDELFAGWTKIELRGTSDQYSPRAELLWLSPRTVQQLEREAGPSQTYIAA